MLLVTRLLAALGLAVLASATLVRRTDGGATDFTPYDDGENDVLRSVFA